MTVELNAPEVQEAIKAAVEEATTGLVNKNRELLGELKQARKGNAVDPAKIDELEAMVDNLKQELSNAQKASKALANDAEKIKKQYESEAQFTQRLLVDNGLLESLTKSGVVNPVHQKAAIAMLRGNVSVVVEGDARVAKVGDKGLSDFVKEWAVGDEGKFFVSAPQNTGSGANGGKSGNGQTQLSRADFEALPAMKKAELVKAGVTLI